VARRAGLCAGQEILDAGCGVAGPALDWAREIPELSIQGLTLCPTQQVEAAREIGREGLQERIHVRVGDYHALPYADESFDRVLYLESSGYSYDRKKLFSEAWRVLRPGGLVYIKDVFRHCGPLSGAQWRDLAAFDELYAQRTPTLEQTQKSLLEAGFSSVEAESLDGHINMSHYQQAIGNPSQPTSFGRLHHRTFRVLPVFFAQLCGYKGAPKEISASSRFENSASV
jgi:ubiquinone/menaquinone biosynthesis C-methylase UbiE